MNDCARHLSLYIIVYVAVVVVAVVWLASLALEKFCQYHLVGIVKIAKAHSSSLQLWRVIVPRFFSVQDITFFSIFFITFLFVYFSFFWSWHEGAASQAVNLFCFECFIN